MKLKLLILLCFGFMFNANAAVFVDPYYGFVFNGKTDDDSNYDGSSYGARFGYKNLGLFLGLDYRMATLKVDKSPDLESTNYAAVIGYEFPILFRVWGEYILGGKASIESADFTKPSGTVLGVGYTGLPFVSLNLEMMNWKYDEIKVGGTKGDAELEGSHILFSVSLPLSF